MAEDLFASKTGGVNPRQKRIMMVVGAAAVLALIFMLSRGGGEGGGDVATGSPQGYAGGEPPFGAGSTFADNGEAAGGLSTAITDGLADVSTMLYTVDSSNMAVAEGLADLGERIEADEVAPVPVSAPGPLAAVGQPAGAPGPTKKPKVKTDKFGRTDADKAKIKRERLQGKENKLGWTPTEQKLAQKSPAYSNQLVQRTREERKEQREKPKPKPKPQAKPKPQSKPQQRNASTPPRDQPKPPTSKPKRKR